MVAHGTEGMGASGLPHRNAPARQRQGASCGRRPGFALAMIGYPLVGFLPPEGGDLTGYSQGTHRVLTGYPLVGCLPPEGGDGREPPVVVCEYDARPLPPRTMRRTVVTVRL